MRRWLIALGLLSTVAACAEDDGPQGPVCGNGVREANETCDGSDLAGESCQSQGWTLGVLRCAADCTLDVAWCVGGGPRCGNWIKEYGEDCDLEDFRGATCASLGYGEGTLACHDDCTFDRAGCSGPASCGDGLRQAVEECDGADTGGVTCAGLGFLGGEIDCLPQCVLDVSACTLPDCGNGVTEPGEECDGADLDGRDCVMLGHAGGVLGCHDYCLFDESGCTE